MTSKYPCPACGQFFELRRVELRDGRYITVFEHRGGQSCEAPIEPIPVASSKGAA